MNNSTETKGNTNSDEMGQEIKKAKEEVREKIHEAENKSNPNEEKDNLAKTIVDQLKSIFTAAEEAVREDQEINQGRRVVEQKKSSKETVLIALTKAVEAIKLGLDLPISDQGKAILKGIADTGKDLTYSTASAIEYYLFDYLVGEKNIFDPEAGRINQELIKNFNELSQTNRAAANLIKEALKKTVEKGKISGLTEEIIERDLKIKEIVTTRQTKERLSLKEEEERKRIYRLIDDKLREAVKHNQINFDDTGKIHAFLMTGELNNEVISIAGEIGVPQEDLQRFSELTKRMAGSLDFGIMESYLPSMKKYIEDAEEEFSLDSLTNFFERDTNGRLIISSKKRQELKDKIRKYYYFGLRKIHDQPSETFHRVLQDHQEVQYYFMMLRQVIDHSFEKIIEALPDIDENQELKLFLTDLVGNFQMRITGNAQVFHDMPLLARDMSSVEKLLEFFKYIYPTQIAEVFDDEGLLMVLARDEMVMMLREYLVTRGNQYDGSLLSGEYNKKGARWSQWFKDKFKENLRRRLRAVGEDEKYFEKNSWKLEMIASYAEGIGIATLVDPEVLSTSDPVPHYREVHPLMSLLSAKHNWLTGRGTKSVGLITKYLLGLPVTLYPNKRHWLLRLITKGWKPEAIKKEIDENVEFYGERAVDGIFNAGGLYLQLLSMFNLPNSISSWAGWRIEQIPKDFGNFYEQLFGKEIGGSLTQKEWDGVFDLGLKLYGTSFLWWSIKGGAGRLTQDIERRLKKLNLSKDDLYHHRVLDRVILSDFDGRSTKLNYLEFEQLKLDQRRADLFFRYLRRNPGDFLMVFHQICPEIFEFEDKKLHYLLFDPRFGPNISDKEVKAILESEKKSTSEIQYFLKKRQNFFRQWEGNYDRLIAFRQWLEKVADNDLFKQETEVFDQEKKIFVKKKSFSKEKFIEKFREASAVAYARLKTRNEKLRQEILYSNLSPTEKKQKLAQLRMYLTKEDFKGYETYWGLFADDGGLFESMTGIKFNEADSFFANFGGVDSDGKKTIFFNMAHNWNLDKGENNPFAADICYYELFANFKKSGESTIKRTFEANIGVYKEILSKLGSLENILHHISQTGDLKEIIDLHTKIHSTLSGLVGQEYAWRANYILAQIVAGFFAEHNIPRSPLFHLTGPVGWIVKMFYGDKLSLSKLLTHNRYAHSMDTNALRDYFLILKRADLINHEDNGIWGMNQLNRVFEATNAEYIVGQVVPDALWAIALLILLISIKKGLEEFEGKKK